MAGQGENNARRRPRRGSLVLRVLLHGALPLLVLPYALVDTLPQSNALIKRLKQTQNFAKGKLHLWVAKGRLGRIGQRVIARFLHEVVQEEENYHVDKAGPSSFWEQLRSVPSRFAQVAKGKASYSEVLLQPEVMLMTSIFLLIALCLITVVVLNVREASRSSDAPRREEAHGKKGGSTKATEQGAEEQKGAEEENHKDTTTMVSVSEETPGGHTRRRRRPRREVEAGQTATSRQTPRR